MSICRLALLVLSVFSGCSGVEDIRFSDAPSLPGCVTLDRQENEKKRAKALAFFRSEVGVTFSQLTIDHGVIC